MKRYGLIVIVLVVFGFLYCTFTTVGTTDETSSGVSLFKPDGNPAAGALVQFYTVGDTSTQFIHQVQADSNGRFVVLGEPLKNGYFNVWAHLGDSLVAIQDSVFISATSHFVKNDTLHAPGSISGIVGLQPHHDPRTVTVHALGTHIYDNVNLDGEFTLTGMAAGEYVLRLSTTLPEYSDTFANVTARSNIADTISDTLWLIYTGIPVVTGLDVAYDTLNGVVSLSWKKTKYPNFQNYSLYKTYYDSIVWPQDPFALSIDTIFNDTIFKDKIFDLFSLNNTINYHLKYRVCVENNSGQIGLPFKFADVLAVPPQMVTTSFNISTRHVKKDFLSDSASINDSMQILTNLTNPTRFLKKIMYLENYIDTIKQFTILEDSVNSISDTIYRIWDSIGRRSIEIIAEDNAGDKWKDTILISIVDDKPIIKFNSVSEKIYTGIPKNLQPIVYDKYGEVIGYEWDIGNWGKLVKTSTSDTTITINDSIYFDFQCVFQCWDDDSNFALDTLHLQSSLRWEKITDISIPNERSYGLIKGNDAVYFLNTSFPKAGKMSLWKSYDMRTWDIVCDSMPVDEVGFGIARFIYFNSSFYLIHQRRKMNSPPPVWFLEPISTTVWSSTDGVNWQDSSIFFAETETGDFDTLYIDDDFHIIDSTIFSFHRNYVYYSNDCFTWKRKTLPDVITYDKHELFDIGANKASTQYNQLVYFILDGNTHVFNPQTFTTTASITNNINRIGNPFIFKNVFLFFTLAAETIHFSKDGIQWKFCLNRYPGSSNGFNLEHVIKFNNSYYIVYRGEVWELK